MDKRAGMPIWLTWVRHMGMLEWKVIWKIPLKAKDPPRQERFCCIWAVMMHGAHIWYSTGIDWDLSLITKLVCYWAPCCISVSLSLLCCILSLCLAVSLYLFCFVFFLCVFLSVSVQVNVKVSVFVIFFFSLSLSLSLQILSVYISVLCTILLHSSIPQGNYSAKPKETLGKSAIQCCSSKLMWKKNSTKLVKTFFTSVCPRN